MDAKEKRRIVLCLKQIFFSAFLTILVVKLIMKSLRTVVIDYSIWSVLLFGVIYYLLGKYVMIKEQITKRKKNFLALVCIVFSLAEVTGAYLVLQGSVFSYGVLSIIYELLMIMAFAVFLYLVSAVLTYNIRWSKPYGAEKSKRYSFVLDCVILMIGWMPVLLAYYPGIFAYDASAQVMQVINHSYTTHHPLLHTIMLGKLFEFGRLLGNNNFGILLYSILQMGILAIVISWSIDCMRKNGLGKKGHIIVLAIYIMFPVHPMMAISTTKDILFGAFALASMTFFIKVSDDAEKWNENVLLLVGSLALIGMMLFRNNAMYACIFSCPFLIIMQKESWKKYILLILICVLITSGINWGLNSILHSEKGSMVEMLSVPLQQMARVGNNHGGDIDEELREDLYYFIPHDVIEKYTPNISDGVKNFVDDDVIKSDLLRFIRTYLKLGLLYPRDYIDAFACLTQGFWYMEDTSNAEIYGVGMESRLGYILTNYKQMPEGYEVKHVSYFPWLEHGLEKLFSDNKYKNIPILSLFFSPALYGWILVIYIAIGIYLRKYQMIVPVFILFCYHLTLLLGPTCIIRYVYPVVLCLPVMIYRCYRFILNCNDCN